MLTDYYVLSHFAWNLSLLMPGSIICCDNSVVSDTCVSMEEWVAHPTEHTALDDIIPCVEAATANESLYKTRHVTFQLVNVVNQAITNVTNRNFPANVQIFYYNQSGPLMPLLCNPFTPDLKNRTCTSGEVTLDNAAEVNTVYGSVFHTVRGRSIYRPASLHKLQVYRGFECRTTTVQGAEICATVGRVTPRIYRQMDPRVVPVRPVPRSVAGLHLRPRHLHDHRAALLPRPAAVQQVGVRRPGDGLVGGDAVPGLLGDLRQGAAPPRVQQAARRQAQLPYGRRQAGPRRLGYVSSSPIYVHIYILRFVMHVHRCTLGFRRYSLFVVQLVSGRIACSSVGLSGLRSLLGLLWPGRFHIFAGWLFTALAENEKPH
jgi:hypothetical protein